MKDNNLDIPNSSEEALEHGGVDKKMIQRQTFYLINK